MATFFRMEAANLFVGEDATGKHLTLDEIMLPELEWETQDHTPGGGFAAVEFATHLKKLEGGFNLNGEDPDLLAQMGLGSDRRSVFTVPGAVRNERTGDLVEAKAVIEGILGKVAPGGIKLGELRGYEYGIKSIMRYSYFFGGVERWHWNYWTNELRTGGIDRRADVNRILQIV